MVWLQSPPWGRWILAGLIAAVALWVELAPEPTESHPFAIEDIEPGEVVDDSNTESRPVASGLLTPVEMGSKTRDLISAGDPVLVSDLGGDGTVVPPGWWVMEVALPRSAVSGDRARLVILDTGEVVPGVVVEPVVEDPLGSGLGTVAIAPDGVTDAAIAATGGRLAVLIGKG
jgi:hypothetical protein